MFPSGRIAPFISFIPKAISRGVVTILSAFERGRRSLPSRATMRGEAIRHLAWEHDPDGFA